LIAEQVANVFPNLVADAHGQPYTVLYQELPALQLADIQRQQHQVYRLQTGEKQLNRLQTEINELTRTGGRRGPLLVRTSLPSVHNQRRER
jgi:hypothetical protein